MALKIYTEDDEGNVIGETDGKQYVNYDDVQAEVDASIDRNQPGFFREIWFGVMGLKGIIALLFSVIFFFSGEVGSSLFLMAFGVLAIFTWRKGGRRKRKKGIDDFTS